MSRGVHARTIVAMGTLVTVRIVGNGVGNDVLNADPAVIDQGAIAARDGALDRALAWFHDIEASCSRFDPKSELMQLSHRVGEAVPVSAALFESLAFALAVAEETNGAFDPTVGAAMEGRGFNREHRTLAVMPSGIADDGLASYRDVRLDAERKTVTLLRPLVLDLGAVAKGLAVDMAARELAAFRDYAIDAGGDLYLAGSNESGEPWRVGIRHPREDHAIIDAVRVSDMAVCTSGDYERRTEDASGHILNPRTRQPVSDVVSATVVAETAMLADAAATAAFVLGPAEGLQLFDRLGVNGLVITSTLERFATRGMPSELAAPVLPNAQRSSDDRARDPGRDRGAGGGR